MMTTVTADQAQSAPLSVRNKIGLALCGLLGLADIAGLLAIGQADTGEPGPPTAVLVAGGVLGVITVLAALFTWRTQSRMGSRVVAGARVLSALTSVPAFFVEGVGGGLVVLAGAGIVITLFAIWLLLSRPAPR